MPFRTVFWFYRTVMNYCICGSAFYWIEPKLNCVPYSVSPFLWCSGSVQIGIPIVWESPVGTASFEPAQLQLSLGRLSQDWEGGCLVISGSMGTIARYHKLAQPASPRIRETHLTPLWSCASGVPRWNCTAENLTHLSMGEMFLQLSRKKSYKILVWVWYMKKVKEYSLS